MIAGKLKYGGKICVIAPSNRGPHTGVAPPGLLSQPVEYSAETKPAHTLDEVDQAKIHKETY